MLFNIVFSHVFHFIFRYNSKSCVYLYKKSYFMLFMLTWLIYTYTHYLHHACTNTYYMAIKILMMEWNSNLFFPKLFIIGRSISDGILIHIKCWKIFTTIFPIKCYMRIIWCVIPKCRISHGIIRALIPGL